MVLRCDAIHGGEVRGGTVWLAPFSVPATHKQVGPFWCWFLVGGLVHVLGPCGSLQQTLLWGWEFLPLPQPPQEFSVRSFEALFPRWSPGLRDLSRSPVVRVYCRQMGDRPVCQPQPHLVGSCCLARCSYQSGWMFQLPGCQTSIQFDFVSSGCFLFLNLFLSFWLCEEGIVHVPMPPSWPEVPQILF